MRPADCSLGNDGTTYWSETKPEDILLREHPLLFMTSGSKWVFFKFKSFSPCFQLVCYIRCASVTLCFLGFFFFSVNINSWGKKDQPVFYIILYDWEHATFFFWETNGKINRWKLWKLICTSELVNYWFHESNLGKGMWWWKTVKYSMYLDLVL